MRAFKLFGWAVVVGYLALTGFAVMATQESSEAPEPAASQSVVVAEEPSIVDVITDKSPDWLELASLFTLLASGLAALTPTPKDDGFWLFVRKVIDLLAVNVGGAKPAARRNDNILQ